MAVRNDFTAGEVLAAADLNDTFAAKVSYAYGTAEPTTTVDGFVWFDENDTPPTPKFWDGSAFVPFPSGAGDAVISSPAATGQYTDSGITYDYYTFTSSGTLTVDTAGFADVLVIGGGGGGGASGGGGGGAGGYLAITDAYLPAGTATVTVGAGAPTTNFDAANGNTSRLGDYYAVGGGAGARGVGLKGLGGGNGGGGEGVGAGGPGVGGQGSDGGSGASGAGGGGGGASAAGGNATTNTGGAGGDGIASSITGSSVTRGGGGGGSGDSTSGAGGAGGGAAGGGTPTAATANTGGGGGGGGAGPGQLGGASGSGVVIVRVKV